MYFLSVLVVVVALSVCMSFFNIKKIAAYLYAAAFLISVAGIYFSFTVEEGTAPAALNIFIKIMRYGHVGMAFLVVVMMLGALDKNKIVIKLYKIRGELSILGVIFLLNHFVYYIVKIGLSIPLWGSLSKYSLTMTILVSVLSIWAWIICIPLFITSFKIIRKKMSPKKWKDLQRYAYIMYALVYLHIMIAFFNRPDPYAYIFDMTVYSSIFLAYICLRLRMYALKHSDVNGYMIKGLSFFFIILFLGFGFAVHYAKDYSIAAEKNKETLAKKSERRINMDNERGDSSNKSTDSGEENDNSSENIFNDGDYSGEARGYRGTVKVNVTIKDDDIKSVRLVEHSDDAEYINRAKSLLKQIENSDSTDVDVVSGATISSKGLIKATENALEKAVRR